MGYVRTPDEVARITRTLRAPRFDDGQALSVDFLTTAEVVSALLPPGLEPVAQPLASVRIGRWRSNCVGDFSGAGLYLRARHQGLEGDHVVAMWMSTWPAVTFGREVLGEPKRLATSFLTMTATGAAGWVERDGIRLIDLTATLDTDHPAVDVQTRQFTYQAQLAPDGAGLVGDAALLVTDFSRHLRVRRTGTGRIELASGPQDPVATIPVCEVLGATYSEGDTESRTRRQALVSGTDYLPFALANHDDYSLLVTSSRG